MHALVGTCFLCRKDLAGPSRIPQVPGGAGGGAQGGGTFLLLESWSPLSRKWPWSPGITLAPPFLMGKLRPREVEQACLRPFRQPSQGSAVSGVWVGEWVFQPAKGSWWPSDLAVTAPDGCPGSEAAGFIVLRSQEPVPTPLTLWVGRFLAGQATPQSRAVAPPPLPHAPWFPLTPLPR